SSSLLFLVFFFQAEDGIRDRNVTGVQTCALPILVGHYIWLAVLYAVGGAYSRSNPLRVLRNYGPAYLTAVGTMSSAATLAVALRSEERRVGNECGARRACEHTTSGRESGEETGGV